MTRGEHQAFDPSLYDSDFYVWTQQQAAALRALPRGADEAAIDIDHVAEEIEDMGKRDLRAVMSLLERVIEHLLKLATFPESVSAPHWASEIVAFQRDAVRNFAPGMRQLLDMDSIWKAGRENALAYATRSGSPPLASRNPFTLDDMLATPFDIKAALAAISAVGTEDTRTGNPS